MVLNVHRNRTAYEGRGERVKGVWRWGEKEIIYLSLHCHHQELCENRGGRPGLSVLTSLLVSVDVKIY